jgi:diaminopimelate epimerase
MDLFYLKMTLRLILKWCITPDGNQSTMCGNGGRCLVAFAKKLNVIDTKTVFNAVDGLHHASLITTE